MTLKINIFFIAILRLDRKAGELKKGNQFPVTNETIWGPIENFGNTVYAACTRVFTWKRESMRMHMYTVRLLLDFNA